MPDPSRIFVVGCPRSGTTLLQSMLAAHPAVLAFPETHALWGLESTNPLRRRVGLRSAQGAVTWAGLPALGVPVHGHPPHLVGPFVRAVVAALDDAATAADRPAWSEKTPGHLRSLHLLRAYAPDAHVVHVVRMGVPAVTSLYAVTQEHGAAWSGERSVELCLTRWRNDLRRTAAVAGRPRQSVVSYEALVAHPGQVLTALVAALGLPGDPAAAVAAMIAGYRDRAGALSSAGEEWKGGVAGALADRNAARAGTLTPAESAMVEAGVEECAQIYAALPFLGTGG